MRIVEWMTPKTDWKETDFINVEDFNRIRNNILWVKQESERFYKVYDFTTPLVEPVSYNSYAFTETWNNLEDALDDIVKNTDDMNIGEKKTFYAYEQYIDFNELNRIESACLTYKEMIEAQEITVNRLSFILGYEGVKI